MVFPLRSITPAIELLSEQVDVLPASGGAIEDLQWPDADEREDMLINRESGEITEFLETPYTVPLLPYFGVKDIYIAILLMGVFELII